VIDLSNLSGFSTPLGASELIERNGGRILLNNDNVFLLVNVTVNLAGYPPWPPTPTISLRGRAWRSYWVEVRDTRAPDSPWRLFRRVAQTNDLQAIAGPPKAWQAFRVWEFVADPAILDLGLVGPHAPQLTLFGAPGSTWRVESAPGLVPPVGWTPGASVTLTNPFRIFPSMSASEARRFYRAKQP
jgi:hypothetical protein